LEDIRCEECNIPTEKILVDEDDESPLEFCSWECLAKFACKRVKKLKEEE
jgi:hypothetical protein